MQLAKHLPVGASYALISDVFLFDQQGVLSKGYRTPRMTGDCF
jgi:hypothetical protein